MFVIAILLLMAPNKVSAAETTEKIGEEITYTYDSGTATLTTSGSGTMEDYTYYNAQEKLTASWDTYSHMTKKIVIEDEVLNVGKSAFFDFINVTEAALGDSVKNIGDSVFINVNLW